MVTVTITVEREARGEGDRPVTLYAVSAQLDSIKIDPRTDTEGIQKALNEAAARLQGAMEVKPAEEEF